MVYHMDANNYALQYEAFGYTSGHLPGMTPAHSIESYLLNQLMTFSQRPSLSSKLHSK